MLVYCPGERAEFRALTEAGTDNNLSLYLSLRKKNPKQTNKVTIYSWGEGFLTKCNFYSLKLRCHFNEKTKSFLSQT